MRDLDTYLTHCYDLLLKDPNTPEAGAGLPACTILIEHDDNHEPKSDYQNNS